MNRLLGWLAICCGCTPALESRFGDPRQWQVPDAAAHPDDVAVVVERSERLLLSMEDRPWKTQYQQHQVVAVLREGAYDELGTVHIDIPDRFRLVDFRARTIAPDGTLIERGRSDLLEASFTREVDLHADEDDERGGTVYTFLFPAVEVGCLLEHVYTYEMDWIITSDRLAPHSRQPYPVKDYRVEIVGSPGVRYAANAYNSRSPVVVDEVDGMWRIRWQEKDVPAEPDESWAPHWSTWQPWLAYRTQQLVVGNWVRNRARTWDDVMRWQAEQLYVENEKQLEGFSAKLDRQGCDSRACLVDRALAFVRKRAEWSGPGPAPGRPLRHVLRVGRATTGERAFLIWKLLTDAGVETKFALASLSRGRQTGFDFPMGDTYDHTLLLVPAQEGIPEALWIDSACEHCARGELPETTRHAPVQVLSATARFGRAPEVSARSEIARGALAAPGAVVRTTTLTLTDDAGVTGVLTERYTGGMAARYRRATRDHVASDWNRDADRALRGLWPSGELLRHRSAKCDREKVSCERTIEFRVPDHVVSPSPDVRVVAMTVQDRGTADWFREPTRKLDLVAPEPQRHEEILRFAVPEGFTAELPPDERESSGALTYEFDARLVGGEVVLRRALTTALGMWSPAAYEQLRQPARRFVAAWQKSAVLRRAPSAAPTTMSVR